MLPKFRYYLSGPMSGLPNLNYPYFEHVANVLRSKGFIIVSPHEIKPIIKNPEYTDHMRADLLEMLKQCDVIVMLKGFINSKGAMIEFEVARALGFKIYFYHDGNLVDL